MTDAAKITERFRRVSYGRMEIDVTVDDPKEYTKPWTVRVNQRAHARAGADRVHLQREQPLLRASLIGGARCATPTATPGSPS